MVAVPGVPCAPSTPFVPWVHRHRSCRWSRSCRSDPLGPHGSGLAPELVRSVDCTTPGCIDCDPGDLGRLSLQALMMLPSGRRGGAGGPGQARQAPGDEEGRRLSEPGDRSRNEAICALPVWTRSRYKARRRKVLFGHGRWRGASPRRTEWPTSGSTFEWRGLLLPDGSAGMPSSPIASGSALSASARLRGRDHLRAIDQDERIVADDPTVGE